MQNLWFRIKPVSGKTKDKKINISKNHRLSKLTVKWIPMLLQRWEFLHKESIPFSVEFQYLEH
jgi:hypothetical protein